MRKMSIVLLAGLVLALVPTAASAAAPRGQLLLESAAPSPFYTCSYWHEVSPTYCQVWHMTVLSAAADSARALAAGSSILLNDAPYTVDWTGPIYSLESGESFAAVENWKPGSPVCQIWEEIDPPTGRKCHVKDWSDNGDGVLSPCDKVVLVCEDGDVIEGHVEKVTTGVKASPVVK